MVPAVILLSLALFQPAEPPATPPVPSPAPDSPAPGAASPTAPPPVPASPAAPETAAPPSPSPVRSTPLPPAEVPPQAFRPEANPEVILTMKSGGTFQGILLKKDEKEYVLEIAGVPAKFPAEKVERVRELRPVLERYKELRDAAGPNDIDQRISLIRWLADRRQLDLASTEAELLQMKNPRHVGVQRLIGDLRIQTELRSKPAPDPEKDPAAPAPQVAAHDDGRVPPTEFPFLTDEQVGLVKVFELDLAARPRVLFPREAVARMLEDYATSPLVPASQEGKDAILRQDPVDSVALMFRLRARDYYAKVRVIDQPEPMRKFRDDVHRVTILTGCATSQCHGGRDAGRLVLSSYRPNTDTTLYTNFYILNSFRTASGQSLIDWDRPEQSPLLQIALPRELSRFRHPPAMKDGKDIWRPALTGPEDRQAKGIVDWIKSVYRPRPEYTLDYTPFRPFSPAPPSADPAKAASPAVPVVR